MKSLHAVVDVDAPAERVWRIVSDFGSYPEWNPLIVRWKGAFKLSGLCDGRHALIVDPLDGGRSRFTTHEDVTGVLLPFAGKVLAASQQGFELMARAVKERAEA